MDNASARAIEASDIPLIDLAPLRDGSDPQRVGKALHAASRQLGFIYLTGHGIPDTVIANARASDFFVWTRMPPLSRASCVWYPPQPPGLGDAQFGVAPHTDFGVLTVLCRDEVGGLQVQDAVGEWLQAPPPTYEGHGVIFLYALHGSAIYAYGRDEYTLDAGDSRSLDAELSHGLCRVLTERFTFLWVQAESRR